MEFKDVVRRRRMVRNYLPDPVDPAAVERIVDAGLRGPSAGFTQGIYLIVVTDPVTRKAAADLGEEPHFVAEGFPPWMSTAPVHIVVCTSEADYHARYHEPDKLLEDGEEMAWPVPYWHVDVGAALMLVLLAAVDEGLSAGLFGFHRLDGLRELLGIPEEVLPIGVVTIGYPADEQTLGSATRGRKPKSEQIRREHWDCR